MKLILVLSARQVIPKTISMREFLWHLDEQTLSEIQDGNLVTIDSYRRRNCCSFRSKFIEISFGSVMCNYLLLQQSVNQWTQMESIFLVSRKDYHPQLGMRCHTIILGSASAFIMEGPHEMNYVDGDGRSFFDQDMTKPASIFHCFMQQPRKSGRPQRIWGIYITYRIE